MNTLSGTLPRLLRPLLLLALLILSGCAESQSSPPPISLRYRTAIERRATLSLLKRAWEDRPDSITEEHKWYERRLLNRIGFFGKKVNGTESFRPVSQFWLECLGAHQNRYDD
ncbi:MAG: hypothetical protein ACHQ5A_02125 [Opitutales bacterium]